MAVIIILVFAVIAGYEHLMLRKTKASRKRRILVFSVCIAALLFNLTALYFPQAVNPNKAIEALFGPIQDQIQIKHKQEES
ncbi:hypothetical protein [Paenibacillus sp. GYB003]|uniref:hypothetical protein n=1 Tax=Paenibacillus sp. GYB003 TaxID=2994392 RepID=UPI002F9619AA